MKTNRIPTANFFLTISAFLVLTGCKNEWSNWSTIVYGDDKKMNGGFELVKQNLPVNWWFYTPDKSRDPSADFDIVLDITEHKEGYQSLNFVVRKCSNIGGLFSPGFFNDFNAIGGETYLVSFWLMNKGSSLKISLTSDAYLKPRLGGNDTTLIINEDIPDWNYYEFNFTVPLKLEMIRYEVNILKPGNVWFDDIKIAGNKIDKSDRTIR